MSNEEHLDDHDPELEAIIADLERQLREEDAQSGNAPAIPQWECSEGHTSADFPDVFPPSMDFYIGGTTSLGPPLCFICFYDKLVAAGVGKLHLVDAVP